MPLDTAKKGISSSKLMGRDDGDALGKVGGGLFGGLGKTGKLATIVGSNKKAISINARKITSLKNIVKENQKQDAGDTIGDKLPGSSGGIAKILGDIADNMDSIKNTIIEQQNLDKKSAEKDRIDAEKGERAKKEKDLESKFSGIKKIGSKVLGPVKSLWERLLNFITTIFLGRVAMKLFEWFSDPKNTEKIEAIGRFLKDFWPALLAGYLLFGNALGRFITGLGINLVKWTAKLLSKVIPALAKAMARMGGGGVGGFMKSAAVGGIVVGATQLYGRMTDDDDPGPEDVGNRPVGNKTEKMNKGGPVPGSGNTDTVPAMLTPGEFVMSKGAVQKYGIDTMEGMNAAAGGTNRPTYSRGKGGYNEGGKASGRPGVVTDPAEKARIEAETLAWVNKERVEFLGLPPLDKISYADGVELTKPMGKEYYGAGIKETSNTDMNFDTMTKSTWRTKSRGAETIFQGSVGRLTEEDKQAYLDSNPVARMALELKDQAELDALGASISASARMNGGGLVQGFGGRVRQMGRSASNRMMKLAKSIPNVKKINPRPKKTTSTVAYDQAMKDQAKAQLPNQQTRQDLPQINAGAMISQSKIKTLGITV